MWQMPQNPHLERLNRSICMISGDLRKWPLRKSLLFRHLVLESTTYDHLALTFPNFPAMSPDLGPQWNWRAFSDRSDVRRFAGTSLFAKLAVPFRCAF